MEKTKVEIIEQVKNVKEIKGSNSMGVSESYYNPFYMLSKCFEYEELEKLTTEELNNLYKLADFASDIFY